MAVGPYFQTKNGRVSGANLLSTTGLEISLWQCDGNPCAGAVPPTSYANPTNATSGSLGQPDPTGGKQCWLTSLLSSGMWAGAEMTCHDRLLHISGLSGTALGAQNINGGSPATLSRTYSDVNGVSNIGNEIWIETYSAVGSTAQNITCSYHNEVGTLQTTQAVAYGGAGGGNPGHAALSMLRLPLAAGDRGVSDVVSVTLAGSTGTAGNFGLLVTHPLAFFACGQTAAELLSCSIEGFTEIKAGACLFWTCSLEATPGSANTLAFPYACFNFVEK